MADRRCGFIALAGRPNVGKSTLVNRLAGAHLAAVSDRPQTTRRAIRAVLTEGETQLIFIDLPGAQRPRDLLTKRMSQAMRQSLEDADRVLLMLAADQRIGPGDRYLARELAAAGKPVTIAVNKFDRMSPARGAEALLAAEQLDVGEEIFPLSARSGEGVAELLEHLAAVLPAGPFMFDVQARTDQPEHLQIAELIREALLRRTFKELPHAAEVSVEELQEAPGGALRVRANILVESDSQRAIVVGAHGRMVKSIGIAARRSLQRELGIPVHLELTVRTRKGWRGEAALLDRLGIE